MTETDNKGSKPNDFDITESVCVSDPEAVKAEVRRLYTLSFPSADTTALENAFEMFGQLFRGELPGYHACDTLYHDIQHSLDIALTTARLLRGYQKVHGELSSDQMLLGIVTALYHDSGYVRETSDNSAQNGAEYTSTHVSRSAEFMLKNLSAIDLGDIAHRAAQIVHLTGYEKNPQEVQPDITSDRMIGNVVATADLVTQMADRCYLEKCRERLFPELTLASVAEARANTPVPVYNSSDDLLYNTPSFYRLHVRKRLEYHFKSVFRYAASYFNGPNYYVLSIENNIRYLEKLIDLHTFEALRRTLPVNYGTEVFPYDELVKILNDKEKS